MKINIKVYLFIIVVFCFTILNFKTVKAESYIDYNKTYKIGVINFEPYVKIDSENNISGYYIDFFDMVANELNLKYEYVAVNNEESISKLETGELDFSLGITITEERAERILFSVSPIALEKYALYSRIPINKSQVYKLDGLRFGAIRERAADWILNFFEASNIKVEVVYADSYEEINNMIDNNEIDFILDSAYKNSKYNKIYEFVESQVYIATQKDNKELLNLIDQTIVDLNKKDAKIDKLYNSYFDLDKLKEENSKLLLEIVFKILIAIVILIVLIKSLRTKIYEIKIKRALSLGKYKINYLPIYRVSDKVVVGFEALLKNKNNSIIYSKDFISDNKKNVIVFESCIWMLKEIIKSYSKIKANKYFKDKDFYISLSIPINQFKNKKFVDEIINLANDNNLIKNTICIGIIGRIVVDNLKEIKDNLNRLKEAGFIMALDDFGIEYSNLNIIQDLDIDIIKIDKTFTYDLDKSLIKREIILFISRIGEAKNKSIILKGINNLEQEEKIKEIDSDKIYVQGSLYSDELDIAIINNL